MHGETKSPIAPLPRAELDATAKASRLMLCSEIIVTVKIKRNMLVHCMAECVAGL